MWTSHVRVARSLPNVRVALVVDPDLRRAQALAGRVGADAATALPDRWRFDAAVVAAPTDMHCELTVKLLKGGVPVLVEKPIAHTLDDAQAMVDAAPSESALMVGHVEQFNTAVLELDRVLHDPLHVQADRLSPYFERARDNVVLDLMIHDLDIVRRIAGGPAREVQAMRRVLSAPSADYACALLEFDGGMTATLTCSRVAQQKIRRLEITESDDFIVVDLLRQDLTIQKVNHAEYSSNDGVVYRQAGVTEIPFLERRGEPLALELEHFVDCVVEGRRPRISGEDGLEALRLATMVVDAAGIDD